MSGCPRRDSALPTGVVRIGGTMASADSLQTVYSAALSRFSRVSPNMSMLLSSRAVCIYLMDS